MMNCELTDIDIDARQIRVTVWLTDEQGTERSATIDLPTRDATCSRCKGRGNHLPESLLCLTEEDCRDWVEDDLRAWHRGDYNIPCERCSGSGSVPEANVDATIDGSLERMATNAYLEHISYIDKIEREERMNTYPNPERMR